MGGRAHAGKLTPRAGPGLLEPPQALRGPLLGIWELPARPPSPPPQVRAQTVRSHPVTPPWSMNTPFMALKAGGSWVFVTSVSCHPGWGALPTQPPELGQSAQCCFSVPSPSEGVLGTPQTHHPQVRVSGAPQTQHPQGGPHPCVLTPLGSLPNPQCRGTPTYLGGLPFPGTQQASPESRSACWRGPRFDSQPRLAQGCFPS